jgi:hypothetical protein
MTLTGPPPPVSVIFCLQFLTLEKLGIRMPTPAQLQGDAMQDANAQKSII